MKLKLDGAGKVYFKAPVQSWGGHRGGNDQIMQTAVFAGQQMMAIRDELDLPLTLHYMGFQSKNFTSMDEAKAAAPEFARAVLAHMSSLIQG